MARRRGAILAAGLLMAAGAAHPQAAGPNPSFIDLFGERLYYALPDWTDGLGADAIRQSMRASRQETETAFLLEFVPSDQSFDDWTDLAAVMAHRDGRDVTADLDEIERNFVDNCEPERLVIVRSDRMRQPPPVEGGFATILCGAFSFDPERGEIAVFRVAEKNGVTARIYREWRGPAFQPLARIGFPVEMEEISRINDRLLRSGFDG